MKKIKVGLVLLLQTVILTSVTLICVLPFSCKVSEEGIVFVGGDYSSPVIEELDVVDERTVQVCFSEKVKLKSYIVSEQIKDVSDSSEHSETAELSPALKAASGGFGKIETEYSVSEDGCVITYSAVDSYEIGKNYEIFSTVEDRAGNTLTFCVPFCGYNSRIPKLVMTEVQPKYKKMKEDSFRCEFVEILALSDGNLSGLELVNGADGDAKKFVFPAEDVRAGDVIVVHLRNAGSGCISETDNLNASTALYSAKNVRDLWSDNTKARLNDNSDVLVIRNSVDGKIFDAFMYAAEDAVEWSKSVLPFAEAVAEAGLYESALVAEAELNSGLGSVAAKAFCRGDAKLLQQRALAGDFADGGDSGEGTAAGAEYPVKRIPENWTIKNVSPGTL